MQQPGYASVSIAFLVTSRALPSRQAVGRQSGSAVVNSDDRNRDGVPVVMELMGGYVPREASHRTRLTAVRGLVVSPRLPCEDLKGEPDIRVVRGPTRVDTEPGRSGAIPRLRTRTRS